MAQKTRRKISANSGAVTVQYLGGNLSQELDLALKRQRLAELNDPFAKMVNELDAQVKFLKAQESFKKLAEGDPKGFLVDAREKLATLSADDPQRRLWEAAVKQAEAKLEDQQWSNDLKLGLKEYEDWKAHLESKLGSERAGSPEASELIQAIASANKAIIARDEAKKDQDALLAYINSKSPDRHDEYRNYLQSKFLRVKDGGVQSEILKQMGQLDERKAKENSIARAKKKSDILTNYLENGGPQEAIKKLQELANDPDVTKEEVEAIQRSVEGILKREEDKIEKASKGSGGSGSGAKAAAAAINAQVDAAELEYEKEKAKIEKILAEDGVPTKDMIADLDAAASVLEATYNAAGKVHPDPESADKLLNAGIDVDTNVSKIKAAVDDRVLKDADLSEQGKSTFAAAVAAAAAGKDGDAYAAAADIAHARLTALVRAKDKLVTVGAVKAADSEAKRVAAIERTQIANLARYKPSDPASIATVDDAYRLYKESTGVAEGDKLERLAFQRALLNSFTVDDLLKKLGFKDNKVKQTIEVKTPTILGVEQKSKKTVEVPRFTEESFTKLKTAAQKAEGRQSSEDIGEELRLWTRLIRTPGVDVTPQEKYIYDMYGMGGHLDEDAKVTRMEAILNPLNALELDDYMDIIAGRSKGPAGSMARPQVGMDVTAPEGMDMSQIQEFEPGMGASTAQAERPEEPTINELAPEEAPGDFQISEGDPWEMTDPVQDAFEWLARPEEFDLQGLTIPTLPEDDSISSFEPQITEFDSPWDMDDDEEEDEEEDDDTDIDPWETSITENEYGTSYTSGGRGTESILE